MRTEIALMVALLSITAGLQVGCGGECGCADIIGIDINTPDEGVDTIPTDDGADMNPHAKMPRHSLWSQVASVLAGRFDDFECGVHGCAGDVRWSRGVAPADSG